ncbi:hypothetical protein J2Z69_002179 [Paenibacillus shirakamiensis]|uniref:Uncharacterized protein n=1 Tax=Paenibacillus shirakamiensis TaxID=1265935 RepID=A0ABS4JJ36_9BACL|nr:hypothetical protein [Paenibacillus shirakamiensis]MBP2001136.1 hypothetical protein [Paenibacillus shirakamiensis]
MKNLRIVLAASTLLGSLLFGFSTESKASTFHTNAANYTDTDLISIWRVTNTGSIYSPVSVKTEVSINATTSGNNWLATKRELVSQTLRDAFLSYPNANFGPGLLNLRGSNVTLDTRGSYIYDPAYTLIGKLTTTSQIYSPNAQAGYGQSVFYGGSGSFQVDSTASVDFNW